jgi:hypothetical protein
MNSNTLNNELLQNFLLDMAHNIDTLSSEHRILLWSFYSKIKVANKPVKEDDMEWVALGLLLKSLYTDG